MKLIDWDQIGMLVVGTASNGIEALELIEKEEPDIVITDIRMPGYDGLDMIEKAKKINDDLEFIIISGYGEFEYAKKAMAFGVRDYLLKPINKDDLLNALLRLQKDVMEKKEQLNWGKEFESKLKKDMNKVREAFLGKLILFDAEIHKTYTLREINENYHFHFQRGIFSIAALKLDDMGKEGLNHLKNIMDEIKDIVKAKLQGIMYELDVIQSKSDIYIVMNYDHSMKKKIEIVFEKILEYLNQRIFGIEKVEITMAFGEEVGTLQDIAKSLKSAQLLIEDRILKGTGRIIRADGKRADGAELENIFYNVSTKFIKAVEVFDMNDIENVILNFKKEISFRSIRGIELKNMIRELANMYYITMKRNNIRMDHGAEAYQNLMDLVNDCNSTEGLFHELLNHITSSIAALDRDKNHSNLKHIRQARKFIEENYMNNITLEDLGAHIGFNPSYFSCIFKKETDMSFIEYLSKVRIEKAKDLLKESDLRIQDVCLMVGYNDVKYFTKSFIKHTGLKPNEYRKVFA
jgi:two-component system response regulator YesN